MDIQNKCPGCGEVREILTASCSKCGYEFIVFSPEELPGRISKISELPHRPPNLHHLLVSGQVTAYKFFPRIPASFAPEAQAHYRRCSAQEISGMDPQAITGLFVDENQLDIPAQIAPPVQTAEVDRRTFIKKGAIWEITFGKYQINLKHNDRVFYLAHLLAKPGYSFDPLELSGLVPKKSATTGGNEGDEPWQHGKTAGVPSAKDAMGKMSEEELNEAGFSTHRQYQEDDDTFKRLVEAFRKTKIDIKKAQMNKDTIKENELVALLNQIKKMMRNEHGMKMVRDEKGAWIPKERRRLKEDAERARKNNRKHIRTTLNDIKKKSKLIFDDINQYIDTGGSPVYGSKVQTPPHWDVQFDK